MRRHLSYIIFLLLSVTITFSCTERVDIELDTTYTRLAVSGRITSDSLKHEVLLTRTTDYFFNQPAPAIDNAIVRISFDDTTIVLQNIATVPGLYRMEEAYKGEPGTTYTLEISNVDIDEDGEIEEYAAVATMPFIAKADSLQLVKFITPFFSGYQLALFSPDPVGANWYNYKILRNNFLLNKRLSDYTVQPDEFINGNYIAGLPVGFLNDSDEDEAVMPGDTITLEINSISKEYYNFITEAQSEIFGNNPLFSGPPANVSTNLSNGALGFFAAYSVDRVSVIASVPAFR